MGERDEGDEHTGNNGSVIRCGVWPGPGVEGAEGVEEMREDEECVLACVLVLDWTGAGVRCWRWLTDLLTGTQGKWSGLAEGAEGRRQTVARLSISQGTSLLGNRKARDAAGAGKMRGAGNSDPQIVSVPV